MNDIALFALVKDAAGRFMSPHGTARLRFALARGRGDETTRATQQTTQIKASLQNQDLVPEIVDLAAELVALQTGLSAADERALLELVLCAIAALKQGSTRLPISGESRAYFRELLASIAGGPAAAEHSLAAIDRLLASGRASTVIGGPSDYKPLILADGCLYLQRMLREEERFVETLARRLLRKDAALVPPPSEVLDAVRTSGAVVLSDEQLRAVSRAVSQPFTVISGGPGTGKTSIVVSILRVLARIGVPSESIALAAPTGKAANRITDSVRRSLDAIASPAAEDTALRASTPGATTLHRLLGYLPSGDRFVHHENNRLPHRVVIVDEGSMIDLVLMERLVRAVRDDARLILLGDAEQLPSVDAGAVLRDIVSDAEVLHQSFRMDPRDPAGRNILTVARRIREGDTAALFEGSPEVIHVRRTARELGFAKVELLETPYDPRVAAEAAANLRRELLQRWYVEKIESLPDFDRISRKVYHLDDGVFPENERAELESLLAHYESARILCITRSALLPTGAQAINAALHAKVVEGARFLPAKLAGASDALLPGEPIVVEKNDYERRLFNGDQGVVVLAREKASAPVLCSVFRGETGLVAHPIEALGDEVALAYAMTVHKAQGSELDHVVVMLPEKDIALSTREILYTALTRARRSVVISGSRRILERGVERMIRRYSGVREKLARALG